MVSNVKFDTEDLWRKDSDHIIHPWTDFSTFQEQGSVVMADSDGAYVMDSDGHRFLDGIGGLWCVNIGYANGEMADAIAEQVRRIPYYSTFTHITTPPAAELAAKLAQLAPGPLNHVFFGTGGSMSNDTAVRIIHFYFNRLGKVNKKKMAISGTRNESSSISTCVERVARRFRLHGTCRGSAQGCRGLPRSNRSCQRMVGDGESHWLDS